MRSLPRLSFVGKIISVFYLSIAMVLAQSVTSHIHVYSHDLASSSHGHVENVHFHHKASETNHANVTEVDLSQQKLLKSFLFSAVVATMFIIVAIFVSSRLLTQVAWPPERRHVVSSWFFSLRPPLRAPPL